MMDLNAVISHEVDLRSSVSPCTQLSGPAVAATSNTRFHRLHVPNSALESIRQDFQNPQYLKLESLKVLNPVNWIAGTWQWGKIDGSVLLRMWCSCEQAAYVPEYGAYACNETSICGCSRTMGQFNNS